MLGMRVCADGRCGIRPQGGEYRSGRARSPEKCQQSAANGSPDRFGYTVTWTACNLSCLRLLAVLHPMKLSEQDV
jgi:hypothetical protein